MIVAAYFPEQDDDEEQKKTAANDSQNDHPELDLSTHRTGPNHCYERLHLRPSTTEHDYCIS